MDMDTRADIVFEENTMRCKTFLREQEMEQLMTESKCSGLEDLQPNTSPSLETFRFTEHNRFGHEQNIDPENNFFNGMIHSCKYWSEDGLNKTLDKKKWVVINPL